MSNERSPRKHTALRVLPNDLPAGLRLVGEVDLSTRMTLRTALAGCDCSYDVHLYLSELAFIDVAGASTLVRHAARIGPQRRLFLHDSPPMLHRMIEMFWGKEIPISMSAS